ncbi:MAG: hypothetical protein Q9217_003241 [Psora testacea]
MVKSRSAQRHEDEMGQTSSQLEPPQIENHTATMAQARNSKERKARSKKSKKKRAVEQLRLDEEQESARALMQLAQGSVEHAKAPYYEREPQRLAEAQVEDSQHQYGPEMSSQDIIARISQDHSSDGKAKKKGKREKEKRARKEVIDALDGLEIFRSEDPPNGQLSSPSDQRDQKAPSDADISRRRSLQALDDSSTGDEVEEYQELSQVQQNTKGPTQTCQPPLAESLDNTQTQESHPGLPGYSASRRIGGVDEATAAKSKLKKKRKIAFGVPADATDATVAIQPWVDQIAESQLPPPSGKGQYAFSPDSDPSNASHQVQEDSADKFVQTEGTDMPIDPVLHSMNGGSPPVENRNMQDIGAVPPHIDKQKRRKRRRVEELLENASGQGTGDEEVPYYSPYASHERRGGPQDHTLLGREAAGQAGFPELESPFVVEPGRESQVELCYVDMTNHRQRPQDLETAVGNEENRHQRGTPSTGRHEVSKNNSDHFGLEEIIKLEAFRDSYCEANNKTYRQFNEIIQSNIRGNPQAVHLFNDLQDLFPTHRRSYVQRFCRRKFHNFSARGTWTPEDDQLLRQAVAEKGTSWKTVGAMIDRFPEDCRDRYRNYLTNAEHRNREQWTQAEIVNLAGAIVDCMRIMKAERYRRKQEKYGHDLPMSDSEEQDKADMKLINWQAVSNRMGAHGGGRSRLQCSFKWNKLKEKDQKQYLHNVRESRQGVNALQGPDDNHTKSGGWRMKQAAKKVTNMLPGDRYDLLQAILQCGAPSEGNIPWKSIGEDWWQGRWNTTERKAGWLMMKREIAGSEGMDYRDVVYRLLTPLLQQGINERWDPTAYEQRQSQVNNKRKNKNASKSIIARAGKAKERTKTRERRAEEAQMTRQGNGASRGGIRSSEFVDDSNVEDSDAMYHHPTAEAGSDFGITASRHYNRFDPLLTPSQERPPSSRGNNEGAADGDTGSVHSRDSLFDEPGKVAPQTEVDEGVSRELAGKVLALQHLT